MTVRSAHHDTFTIERTYDASPAQVFSAWSEPAAKSRWFACHDDWKAVSYDLDFSVGGREHLRIVEPNGRAHVYDARYQDIVAGERIVYSYDMHLDDTRITVSLATVELLPAGKKTRLKFTEQLVVLDGSDNVAARRQGTEDLLDSLEVMLQREAANYDDVVTMGRREQTLQRGP